MGRVIQGLPPGVRMRPKVLTEGDVVMVRYMRRGGLSISELARVFRVHRMTISKCLQGGGSE